MTDSTHLARLATNGQGVASPANGENRGGRSDATTDGMTGRGEADSPTNGDENGRGIDRFEGVHTGAPPHN